MNNQDATEAMPGEVKALSELLQFQDGAIVSRVLLKNKGGTVTLFAFAVGEGLSEHTAPFDALVVRRQWRASYRTLAQDLTNDLTKR